MPTQSSCVGRCQTCVAPLPFPVLFAVSECVEAVACEHEDVLGEMKVLESVSEGGREGKVASAQRRSKVPSCGCESRM